MASKLQIDIESGLQQHVAMNNNLQSLVRVAEVSNVAHLQLLVWVAGVSNVAHL